ncbi:MAG: helix-turn-helix domain-containing protein [Actinomycetota bacterium]|nr:helix-turn-helix domain-containing protein [Actinomycetota bacterium]
MTDCQRPATMTVEQAGALLGISRRSAYRAAAAGDIPTIRLGRRILVPTVSLHAMLEIQPKQDSDSDGFPNLSSFEQTSR